jgi:hypothetical protein
MDEATFKSPRGIDRIQFTNSKINRRRKLKTSDSHTSRSLVFEIFHESHHCPTTQTENPLQHHQKDAEEYLVSIRMEVIDFSIQQ